MTQSLLYAHELPINEKIQIYIPTVEEILDDEDGYYSALSLVVSAPIDFMVQLDDFGIDFSKINDYELFLLMFTALRELDTHLLFGNLDLSKFDFEEPDDGRPPFLFDQENDIVIDRIIHAMMASALRKVNHLERDKRKPGNEEARKYMIERARAKLKRQKNRKMDSQLESLIVAMVNTEQYKYDYETTKNLTIYQFNESVRQIVSKIDYEHKMNGVYAGTIDPKGLKPDELNWLIHK